MGLLVDPRHAGEGGGADRGERLADPERVAAQRQRVTDVDRLEVDQAAVVVGERQVEEEGVAGTDEPTLQLVHDRRHLVVIAMADHAALRRAGRPRGVDVGEEILLVDRRRGVVQRVGVRGGVVTSACLELGQAGEGEDVPEVGETAPYLLDLRQLLVVLGQDADRLGVPDHVRRVRWRAVCIDGGADRTDQAEREVEQAPLEAGRRHDRERLPLLDSEGEQAVRDVVHPACRLGPRDLGPGAVALGEIGRPARSSAPRSATTRRSSSSRPSGRQRTQEEEAVFRLEFQGPHADDLERMDQLQPGHHPRRACPGDAVRPCLRRLVSQLHSECKTPIKNRRWCPFHEREVESDEIVRGWEVAKGQFVIVEDADLEAIERQNTSRSIDIERFVPLDEVDPVYFDRTYFLVPANAAAALRPYVLLRDVLADERVGAIGRFVLAGKEKLCLIRPKGDALVLETMFVAEDVYSQAEIDDATGEAAAPKKAELDLARQLVESLIGEFDPREQLRSEYRQDLKKMLEAKLAGQPIEEPSRSRTHR